MAMAETTENQIDFSRDGVRPSSRSAFAACGTCVARTHRPLDLAISCDPCDSRVDTALMPRSCRGPVLCSECKIALCGQCVDRGCMCGERPLDAVKSCVDSPVARQGKPKTKMCTVDVGWCRTVCLYRSCTSTDRRSVAVTYPIRKHR